MLPKKIVSLLVSMMLILTFPLTALAAAPDTVEGKLIMMEKDAYGVEQVGSIKERIEKLEKDVTGQHLNDNMMARVNTLYARLYLNNEQPSEIAQLNAIEWSINHEVSLTPVQARLSELEIKLNGKSIEGTFSERIDELAKTAFGSSILPMEKVSVPANTLIRVALVTPVNAKKLKAGDQIEVKVAEDVVVDNALVFAKGEPGYGTVQKVVQARNFGRDAEVKIEFENVKSIDGTVVDTFVGAEAEQQMEHMAMAAGAAIAGAILLGPIGVIAGAFIQGKNIDFPAGTELYVQTKTDNELYGVRIAQDNF